MKSTAQKKRASTGLELALSEVSRALTVVWRFTSATGGPSLTLYTTSLSAPALIDCFFLFGFS